MAEFQRVCAVGDVAPGSAISVEVDGEPVAIVHTDGDEFYAIEDVCSHAEVALSEGEIEGATVECWLHGSRFDLKTGEPLELPATEPVPVFPVQVTGDDVLIAMEESAK